MQGRGEVGGLEPLPFRTFEERATRLDFVVLDEAVKCAFFIPENALDQHDASQLWLALAMPYATLVQPHVSEEGIEAAYNSLYFAMTIRDQLVGGRILPPYPFDHTQPRYVERAQFLQAQAAYFDANPTLEAWKSHFAKVLDPSKTQAHQDIVNVVVAQTLAQYEEADRQHFIEAEVARFIGVTELGNSGGSQ